MERFKEELAAIKVWSPEDDKKKDDKSKPVVKKEEPEDEAELASIAIRKIRHPLMPWQGNGFRASLERLDGQTAYRIGLLLAMRAKHTGAVGVMVTGGVGPAAENGVKIFERNGMPFPSDWAEISEMVVNADNVADTIANFN